MPFLRHPSGAARALTWRRDHGNLSSYKTSIVSPKIRALIALSGLEHRLCPEGWDSRRPYRVAEYQAVLALLGAERKQLVCPGDPLHTLVQLQLAVTPLRSSTRMHSITSSS